MKVTKKILTILLILCLMTIPGLNMVILIILLIRRNEKKKEEAYKASKYYKMSGQSLATVRRDAGLNGEYLMFRQLETLEGDFPLLVNLYIPRKNVTTTEIDLLMIHSTGIYVFESKNYSGWIFGNEKDTMWTQCLKGGKKNRFYNPIIQNKIHINALSGVLAPQYKKYMHSYVVFSNHCELKKITLRSEEVKVTQRASLLKVIKEDMVTKTQVLSEKDIEEINDLLLVYTQASEEIKQKHIENIRAIQ